MMAPAAVGCKRVLAGCWCGQIEVQDDQGMITEAPCRIIVDHVTANEPLDHRRRRKRVVQLRRTAVRVVVDAKRLYVRAGISIGTGTARQRAAVWAARSACRGWCPTRVASVRTPCARATAWGMRGVIKSRRCL
jgi:hypothetical protein